MTGTNSDTMPHQDEIIARISGLRNATTGSICDMTNEMIRERGDVVWLELERRNGRGWEILRSHSDSAPMELDESHPECVQAIVKAEAIAILDGEMAVSLGNPEVVDVSPDGEARGEWKRICA